jgi:hypothetical protein
VKKTKATTAVKSTKAQEPARKAMTDSEREKWDSVFWAVFHEGPRNRFRVKLAGEVADYAIDTFRARS